MGLFLISSLDCSIRNVISMSHYSNNIRKYISSSKLPRGTHIYVAKIMKVDCTQFLIRYDASADSEGNCNYINLHLKLISCDIVLIKSNQIKLS